MTYILTKKKYRGQGENGVPSMTLQIPQGNINTQGNRTGIQWEFGKHYALAEKVFFQRINMTDTYRVCSKFLDWLALCFGGRCRRGDG